MSVAVISVYVNGEKLLVSAFKASYSKINASFVTSLLNIVIPTGTLSNGAPSASRATPDTVIFS